MNIPSRFKNVKTLSGLQSVCKKSGYYDVSSVYELDNGKAIAVVNTLDRSGELIQFELEVTL